MGVETEGCVYIYVYTFIATDYGLRADYGLQRIISAVRFVGLRIVVQAVREMSWQAHVACRDGPLREGMPHECNMAP